MGKDSAMPPLEEMLHFKHSAPKYGRATIAVAIAALILGTVTVVALVVVAIEARNTKSELQTRLDSDMHPEGPDHHGDTMAVKGADDPGTKSRWAGKESHHRSKKSDDGSKLTGYCQDLYQHGFDADGVYVIRPDVAPFPFQVYCDFDSDSGWTVIQNNQGTTDWDRTQDSYSTGFGALEEDKNFWLGLEKIHWLYTQKDTLRVDLKAWDSDWLYADYEQFGVGDEVSGYMVTFGEYSGTAGDVLGPLNVLNNMVTDNFHSDDS
uniref:Fibrinogen C-terminal domain-containing protein n=1 Tax=Branchiostoma floridae TaxID=7739 RepID=C3ZQ81_BRAFL|eukprot:XP_002589449.1 hypothetical protein BRAFLDRAFT_80156 [Branchiostoma floridae]